MRSVYAIMCDCCSAGTHDDNSQKPLLYTKDFVQ